MLFDCGVILTPCTCPSFLADDERHFVKYVLAFFAASDGIVMENLAQRFMNGKRQAQAQVLGLGAGAEARDTLSCAYRTAVIVLRSAQHAAEQGAHSLMSSALCLNVVCANCSRTAV